MPSFLCTLAKFTNIIIWFSGMFGASKSSKIKIGFPGPRRATSFAFRGWNEYIWNCFGHRFLKIFYLVAKVFRAKIYERKVKLGGNLIVYTHKGRSPYPTMEIDSDTLYICTKCWSFMVNTFCVAVNCCHWLFLTNQFLKRIILLMHRVCWVWHCQAFIICTETPKIFSWVAKHPLLQVQ